MSRKSITLASLSRQLGISTFTISKALSGKPGMSEETRQRIVEAARQAGYRWKAEGRQADRPRTLAIALPSRFLGEFSYFADLLQGAEAAARRAGVLVSVVGLSAEDQEAERLPATIAQADGVIYLPMIKPTWLAFALRLGPPAIAVDFAHRSWGADSVVWDAQGGVGLCVDHLIAQGHKRIGYIGSPEVAPGYRLRWVGFQEAMAEYGLAAVEADCLVPTAWPPEACLASVRRLLGARVADLPPAIVCDFETTAVATIRTLTELSRGEVAVACADQLSSATLMATPVPHIDYHRDLVGRRAVERLLQRLGAPDEPYEHLRVAVSLRVP